MALRLKMKSVVHSKFGTDSGVHTIHYYRNYTLEYVLCIIYFHSFSYHQGLKYIPSRDHAILYESRRGYTIFRCTRKTTGGFFRSE